MAEIELDFVGAADQVGGEDCFAERGNAIAEVDCVEVGLALEALPDDELLPTVMERAATLAGMPLASLVATKTLMRRPHIEAMKAAMRAENEALATLGGGPANREAIAAFREKRDPDFSNT